MAKKTATTVCSELECADTNLDGHISVEELCAHMDLQERRMNMEFKRKLLEDEDAQRNAQRKMTWFALFGMLLYPSGIFVTDLFSLDNAAAILGDIAPTYFIAISALVAAFFGASAYTGKQDKTGKV
jgi:hypothetical protein